jgi:hypothetical protein
MTSRVDEARELVAYGQFSRAMRAFQTQIGSWSAEEADAVRRIATDIRDTTLKGRERRQAEDLIGCAEACVAQIRYPMPPGTVTGWYQDPLGSGKARYWNVRWAAGVDSDIAPTPLPEMEAPPVLAESKSDAEVIVPGETPGTKVCPRCAEEVKTAALACRFCGHEFSSSGRRERREPQVPPTTSGAAIASFITSLLGLWIAGIPLGIHAQRAIDRSRGRLVGRGFATAGIVLGLLGIVGTIVLVLVLLHQGQQDSCTYTYNATGACVPGT